MVALTRPTRYRIDPGKPLFVEYGLHYNRLAYRQRIVDMKLLPLRPGLLLELEKIGEKHTPGA